MQLKDSIWVGLDQSDSVKGFGRTIWRGGIRIMFNKLNRKRLLKWNHLCIHKLKHLLLHFLNPVQLNPFYALTALRPQTGFDTFVADQILTP